MEKLSGRISSKEAIGNSGDLATSGQPNPESGIPTTLGRRGLLRAGLTSSLTLLTGLAIGGRTSVASQKDQESERKARPHRVIDAHCHPRWIGYDGARMIENMDAAGIERGWLLSSELPDSERDPRHCSTTDH